MDSRCTIGMQFGPMLALCWAHAWAFKGLLRLFAFYFEPMLGQLEFFRGWVCVELTGLD